MAVFKNFKDDELIVSCECGCVCRRTCQLICASTARETCMDAWTVWILFVWQKSVCVSDAQAPHVGRGYGKKNRKHKRKDLTHTVYKMYNKDSRT